MSLFDYFEENDTIDAGTPSDEAPADIGFLEAPCHLILRSII